MIVLGREVFVCKCATDVPADDPNSTEEVKRVVWLRGAEEHLALLPPLHHSKEHVEELRQRLARGEHWVLGLAPTDAKGPAHQVVSYTWLHNRRRIEYPYLPGCVFETEEGVGYGYDAWTPPELRGGGLRRRGFLEELRVLKQMGCSWEASFFVKHQLEGATRSLSKVGIHILPLWRVQLQRDRKLAFDNLAPGDTSTRPLP